MEKELKVINYITLRDSVDGDSETVRMDALTDEERKRIGLILNDNRMKKLGYESKEFPPLTDKEKEYFKKRFKEIKKNDG